MTSSAEQVWLYLQSKVCRAAVYLWLQYYKESAADLNVKLFPGKVLKGVAQWYSCWYNHKFQQFESPQTRGAAPASLDVQSLYCSNGVLKAKIEDYIENFLS